MFFLILILSTVLRFYQITQIPASLNLDEAAIGYNAFALLKTGADEHGAFLPLALKSFGDWKMPVYPYMTTLAIMMFGLNEMVVRLPSILAGIAGTVLIYLIAKNLFDNKKIALVAMLFHALSPWSIYFSRVAYEVNLGTTFLLAGIYLYLKKKWLWSILFFGLTVFTYHAFLIFTPLLVAGLWLFYKKIPWKFLIITFFLWAISFGNSIGVSQSKLSDLSVWNNKDIIYGRIEKFRGDIAQEGILKITLHNKYLGIPYQIAQNYFSSFSPIFLLDKGGQKELHNLGYFGNLYLIDAVFVFAGFAYLFWNKQKNLKLFLVWLIISPVASMITIDHPSSTRLFVLMPLFVLIGAYGVSIFKKFSLITAVLFGLNVLLWLDGYFIHMNIHRNQYFGGGFKEAALLAQKYPDDNFVFSRAENFPYIYFLFYNQIDPREFQKDVIYYPTTPEGFNLVKSFGRYSFPVKLPENFEPKTVYIERFGFHSEVKPIKLPSGEARFWYYLSP